MSRSGGPLPAPRELDMLKFPLGPPQTQDVAMTKWPRSAEDPVGSVRPCLVQNGRLWGRGRAAAAHGHT